MLQAPPLSSQRPTPNGRHYPLPTPAHQDHLDGIRAVAALWVVLSHLWIIPCGLDARETWLGRLTNWTLYSHFAVDIFIVLSGFCLILPVMTNGGLRGGALGFYGRRAWRILPPYFAALALSVGALLARQALGSKPLHLDQAALLANTLLVQDIFPAANVFNGPFWSIAVEWRIYVLFPVLVWLLTQRGKRAVLMAAGLMALAITALLMWAQPGPVLSCPWYLGLFALGLCAGALSAGRSRRGNRQRCGLVWMVCLAGVAALVRAHPVTTRGGQDFGAYLPLTDTFAGVGVAALLLLLSWSPGLAGLLSWKPLTTLGGFAYSLYLVHMPCLLLFSTLFSVYLPSARQPLPRFGLLALTLPLVIALARLFFLAFERPFLRRRS